LFTPGIAAILFETRLGCLSEEVPLETLRFIAAVNTMLTLSETVIFLPRWTRRVLPFWGRFVQAWDDISDVGEQVSAAASAAVSTAVSTAVGGSDAVSTAASTAVSTAVSTTATASYTRPRILPPGVSVISHSEWSRKPVGMAPRDITSGSVHLEVCWIDQPTSVYHL